MAMHKDPSTNGFNRRRFLAASVATIGLHGFSSFAAADEAAKIAPPARHDPTFSSVDRKHLVVALMGDPQLHVNPRSLDHAKTAMDDLAEIPHDFLVVLGDLVQNKPEYFVDYERLSLEPSTSPVYSIAGNADFGAGLDAYQKCTGLPLHYTIHRRGSSVLFIGQNKIIAKVRDHAKRRWRDEFEFNLPMDTTLGSFPELTR